MTLSAGPAGAAATAPQHVRRLDQALRVSGRTAAAVSARIFGPVRRAHVVGTSPAAAYLSLPDGAIVAVVSRDAVALPCAVVLQTPAARLPLGGARGTAVVGAGMLRLDGLDVAVSGQFETAVPQCAALDDAAVEFVTRSAAALSPAQTGLTDAQLRALQLVGAGGPLLVRAVEALLGGGPGLTPAGDDALCGYLTAAAAGLAPEAIGEQLRREIGTRSPRSTTTLSGQLLEYAASGHAVPPLLRLLDSLAGRRDVEHAWEDVLAIGHTSGAALAAGFSAALGPTSSA